MTSVISKDHAFPNGSNGADADPIKADPGGMTNEEKEAVAGVLAKDANKGAAVHVRQKSPSSLSSFFIERSG